MWTKRDLIREAFGELALAGYEFDITPDEEQTALRRLDAMLATWEAKGVRVGYAFPSGPDATDPDTDSGIPDQAVETVFLNLAVRLAAGFGKAVPMSTAATAREGYEALLWATARPVPQQLPGTMPLGAGNGPRLNRPQFFPTPDTSPLREGAGNSLDILQE